MSDSPSRKPDWLKVRLGHGPGYARLRAIVRDGGLHTVCEEALCPNLGRCWEHGRATLMILGGGCTRGCAFCNVGSAPPGPCDAGEPARVAQAVAAMGLGDVVITSVTRDDLADGGAAIWAETLRRVREAVPGLRVEALIPDFGGDAQALGAVLAARPDVLGHNLETVPSLYPAVRPLADYERSRGVLRQARARGLVVKTAIMVGLGETAEQVAAVMRDAVDCGCEIFFIGQYLPPTRRHFPVARYVEPREFDAYRERGLALGLKVVVAAPLVRSSFHSEEQDRYLLALPRDYGMDKRSLIRHEL